MICCLGGREISIRVRTSSLKRVERVSHEIVECPLSLPIECILSPFPKLYATIFGVRREIERFLRRDLVGG